MPFRRGSKAQRGFVAFPVDSQEYLSSREGGLFVRLVVEYPPEAIPSIPSIRVAMDETFVGDDLEGGFEESYGDLEGQELLAAMDRDQARYEAALSRQFPYQGDLRSPWSGRSTSSQEKPDGGWREPLVSEDEYLGHYLAALSGPAGLGSPAAKEVLAAFRSLYPGFACTRLGVPGDAEVLVVEHAPIYDCDWPVCFGGGTIVVRRPDNPQRAPLLSVPYAAVVLLGSTRWSGYSQTAGAYWCATRDRLTDQGRALYGALEALYPGHRLRLTTWLDT